MEGKTKSSVLTLVLKCSWGSSAEARGSALGVRAGWMGDGQEAELPEDLPEEGRVR